MLHTHPLSTAVVGDRRRRVALGCGSCSSLGAEERKSGQLEKECSWRRRRGKCRAAPNTAPLLLKVVFKSLQKRNVTVLTLRKRGIRPFPFFLSCTVTEMLCGVKVILLLSGLEFGLLGHLSTPHLSPWRVVCPITDAWRPGCSQARESKVSEQNDTVISHLTLGRTPSAPCLTQAS